MKDIKRKKAIALIELSDNIEKADEEVNAYLGEGKTIEEKIAFLREAFGVQTPGHPNAVDEPTYWAMLSTIINDKYC